MLEEERDRRPYQKRRVAVHRIPLPNSSLNLPCTQHWNMQVIRIQFQERYRHRSVILLPIRFVPRLSPIRAKDIAIPFIRYSGNNLCVYIGNDGSNKMRIPDAILKPLRSKYGSRCLILRTSVYRRTCTKIYNKGRMNCFLNKIYSPY